MDKSDPHILLFSAQRLTVSPALLEWNTDSHSKGNKGISSGSNVFPPVKNYWSVSELIWLELESYEPNMNQKG